MLELEQRMQAFDYYERINAALFPIPRGSKAPYGIVESFKHDWSRDRVQWERWESKNPGCNFGIVAFASGLIICDIDTSGGDEGRIEAWKAWSDLCTSWGLSGPLSPHVESARGGWHVLCKVPAHIDASTLRQPDAIKKRINVRCIGYTVAAGSYYDGTAKNEESGFYSLFPNVAPPHPAPVALVEHCTRAERILTTTLPGSRDKGDVAALLTWLNDKDAFSAYEDWCAAGMALRIEYGDDGLALWDLCHDETVTPEVALTKWESFSTEPTAQSVTLNSFLKRAHALGWKGNIRPSSAAMFSEVAQLAAAAGANLSAGSAFQGMPMLSGQAELTRLALPLLQAYLAATKLPPPFTDAPTLPQGMSGHGLYEPMSYCLPRLLFQPDTDVLAVLSILHADVFNALLTRLPNVDRRRISLSATNLSEKVERITIGDGWINDPRTGLPENDNSDNISVLLNMLGLELRFNNWLERMEIRGGIDADLRWPEWTYVDDTVVARLRTRANRTKTRFRPAKEFFWETCQTLAMANAMDPVCDLLKTLEQEWDGVPRLASFLSTYCHTPDDAYHAAVGRSLIGGMVSRIRTPGIKFDTMPLFHGSQGTGKSTMLAILAMAPEYFSDSILLGDASKELVLSLAGKTLVEISEMGMRGNTNVNHVKAMLSRTTDAGRTAYARSVTERARRNIFCGSTNEDTPLEDTSGNRRFLPVRISEEIDLAGLRRDVFQLVGEAAALHSAGEDFSIPRDVWAIAAAHQEAARSVGVVEDMLGEWFDRPEADLYILSGDIGRALRMVGLKVERYGAHMQRLGWVADRLPTSARTKVWRRGNLKEAMVLEPVQAAGVHGRVEMRPKLKAPYA